MSPGKPHNLCVILCAERSGSTLLSTLLGGHDQVLAPPETHLFRWPTYEEWRTTYPRALVSLRWLLNQLDASELDPGSLFAGRSPVEVWRWLLDRAGTDRVLVEKTPAYARSDETLARIEILGPFYLHLVRHPIAVAASHLDRKRRELAADAADSLAARSPARLVRSLGRYARAAAVRVIPGEHRRRLLRRFEYWTDQHRRIERFLAAIPPERWLRVGFEPMVAEPERSLRRICGALDLDFQPAMLDPSAHLP
ncbi:MAG: sulfotransferase, partial [Gemmatimonadota bacterium]